MIGRLKLVKQSRKSRRVGCGAFGAHGGDVNDVWRRGRNPGRGFGCPFLRRAERAGKRTGDKRAVFKMKRLREPIEG
jgi:hypothetical protein